MRRHAPERDKAESDEKNAGDEAGPQKAVQSRLGRVFLFALLALLHAAHLLADALVALKAPPP